MPGDVMVRRQILAGDELAVFDHERPEEAFSETETSPPAIFRASLG
jgi:hypothetical protein